MSNSDGYLPTLGPLVRKTTFSMARIGRGIGRFGRGFRGFLGRRWRPILGIACVLVIAHALSIVWFQYAIERELKHLKSEGYIVSFKDIKHEVVADSDNGALLYKKAYELLPKDNKYEILSPEQKHYRYNGKLAFGPPRGLPYGPPGAHSAFKAILLNESDILNKAREELRHSRKSLCLAMEGSEKPKSSFPVVMKDGWPDTRAQCNLVGKLTKLLCMSAIVAAKDGNTNKAVKSLIAANSICNSTTDGFDCAIQASDMRIIACTISRVISISRISGNQARDLSTSLAKINIMSASSRCRRLSPAYIVAMYDEMRKFGVYKEVSAMSSDFLDEEAAKYYDSYFARPQFYWSEFQALRLIDKMTKADYPELERLAMKGGPLCYLACMVTSDAGLDMAKWAENKIRGCRTMLALIAYKDKHGSYPDSLKTLTKSIQFKLNTNDIYSGKDLIYRKTSEGFLLYSVGLNGKDDSGAEPPESEKRSSYDGCALDGAYDVTWKMAH